MKKFYLTLLIAFFIYNDIFAQKWESTYTPWKNSVQSFTIHDHDIWIARGKELQQLTPEGILINAYSFNSAIGDIKEDYEHILWVSTADFLYKLNVREFVEVTPSVANGSEIVPDEQGNIWMRGTGDTLWFLESEATNFSHINLDQKQFSVSIKYNFKTAYGSTRNIKVFGTEYVYGPISTTAQAWRWKPGSSVIETFFVNDSLWWNSTVLDSNHFTTSTDDNRTNILNLIHVGSNGNYWVEDWVPGKSGIDTIYILEPLNRDTIRSIPLQNRLTNLVEDEHHELWGMDDESNIYHSSENGFVQFNVIQNDCFKSQPYQLVFNNRLLKDHLGNIWIQEGNKFVSGTNTSLCDFQLSQFDLPEEDSLSLYYPEIFIDPKGTPWLVCEDSVSNPTWTTRAKTFSIKYYDGTKWKIKFQSSPNSSQNLSFGINKIVMNKQGFLLIYRDISHGFNSYQDIKLFNGKNLAEVISTELDPHKSISTFDLDASGKLWIIGKIGLQKFNGINWEAYDLSAVEYYKMYPDAEDDIIWLVDQAFRRTHRSITRIKNGERTTINLPEELEGQLKIVPDSKKGVWLTSEGHPGLYYTADGITWTLYTMNNGLISNTIDNVKIDGNGNVWALARNLGWSKFSINAVTALPNEIEENHSFNLSFQNPVHSVLSITSNKEITLLKIYSLDGKELMSTQEHEINVSELQEGTYIVKVFNSNGYSSQLFIKN